MSNKNTVMLLFICVILFGIGIWYYYQNINQQPDDLVMNLIPNANVNMNSEATQIERQIDQVQAIRNPPEIIKLDELLTEFKEDSTKWDILIAVGDIYRKGAFPRFLPNEEIALSCYKIASSCPNRDISGMGQSKYIETRDDPINLIDRAGAQLPVEYGKELCKLAEESIQSTPWHLFEKPSAKEQKKVEPIALFDTTFFEELNFQLPNMFNTTNVPQIYRHDSQNVHDHGVTKMTKYNIDALKDNIDINSLDANANSKFEEIKDSILRDAEIDPKTKEDALHVIDNLHETKHSTFNTTEKQALVLVWDKINKEKDPVVQANLKETLAKQLATSIEHGHIVCSSGKISRIMSTLDGVSNEAIRPMWAVREELGTLAANIRDQMTKKYGDTPEAGRQMQEEFSKQVNTEYISKLGMNEKIINPLIEEYSTGF
jgi:hypothetical protein